ncbi:hypothetical protein LC605_29180 [Nostoc sp. CHAB 5836]|nr:hypothetical protein [Nostoc sp. CHAB 5836]
MASLLAVSANASKLLLITTKVKNQGENQDLAFDYFLSPKAMPTLGDATRTAGYAYTFRNKQKLMILFAFY